MRQGLNTAYSNIYTLKLFYEIPNQGNISHKWPICYIMFPDYSTDISENTSYFFCYFLCLCQNVNYFFNYQAIWISIEEND